MIQTTTMANNSSIILGSIRNQSTVAETRNDTNSTGSDPALEPAVIFQQMVKETLSYQVGHNINLYLSPCLIVIGKYFPYLMLILNDTECVQEVTSI